MSADASNGRGEESVRCLESSGRVQTLREASGLFLLGRNKKRVAHAHPQNQILSSQLILRVVAKQHRVGRFYRENKEGQGQKIQFMYSIPIHEHMQSSVYLEDHKSSFLAIILHL